MVTDPPYCILERKRTFGDSRGSKSIRKSKLEDAPEVPKFSCLSEYRQFSDKWISKAVSHGLEDNSYIIIWTNTLGKGILVDVCESHGYQLIGDYVWAKESKLSPKSKLPLKYRNFHPISSNESEVMLRVYESALIFAPKSIVDSNSLKDTSWISTRKLSDSKKMEYQSVLRSSLPWSVATAYHDQITVEDKIGSLNTTFTAHHHPCHKPISALLPLLINWTIPGDLILDPFAGSGGIMAAVKHLNSISKEESIIDRQYCGIEILSNWVEYSKSL
jgi:site-specific DNA-methyltransferase (adenine-specific)